MRGSRWAISRCGVGTWPNIRAPIPKRSLVTIPGRSIVPVRVIVILLRRPAECRPLAQRGVSASVNLDDASLPGPFSPSACHLHYAPGCRPVNPPGSPEGLAAADEQGRSGDEPRLRRRSEKHNGADDVIRHADLPERDAGEPPLAEGGFPDVGAIQVGLDQPRADRVDAN